MITKPTRVTEFSATLIDNIFINTLLYPSKATIFYEEISDHFPILLEIGYRNMSDTGTPNSSIELRKYDPASIHLFLSLLSDYDWSVFKLRCANESDANLLYDDFLAVFLDFYNRAFPLRTSKSSRCSNRTLPWLTKNLIRCCKKKANLLRKYKQDNTPESKLKFTKYRNILKKSILLAEKSHYASLFAQNICNAKRTWQVINEILSNTRPGPNKKPFTDKSGKILTNCETATNFNVFFANVGNELAKNILRPTSSTVINMPASRMSSCVFLPTDYCEVVNIIQSLKLSNSVGHDDVATKILKASGNIIAPILVSLINNSLRHGIFPRSLKIAKVLPIFKTGDKSCYSNYRPISLLPCISKIYEKIIHSRLTGYMSTIGIPSNNQYGFRKNSSTFMAIANFLNDLTTSIDKKFSSIGVFIDLSKAFDTVDHVILLKKLYLYGVRGIQYDLMKSYLSDRQQYVIFNNVASDKIPVTCGIPQGSILGPLLFLIYIDDIQTCSQTLKFILFADDTNIFLSASNINDLFLTLNKELVHLNNWFRYNKLSLNIKKSHYMLFGNNQKSSHEVVIDGLKLLPVTSTKFLGVIIDDKLNWKPHINFIISKINKNAAVIRRIRYKINSRTALKLYDSMILPHISYCAITWAAISHNKLKKIHIIQKKVLRVVLCANRLAPSKPIFRQLQRLTIFDIHKMQVAIFMFSNLKGYTPNLFPDYFLTNSQIHSHFTRSAAKLRLERVRTNLRTQSLALIGPTIWNNIPDHLKQSVSLRVFKHKLKSWLISS